MGEDKNNLNIMHCHISVIRISDNPINLDCFSVTYTTIFSSCTNPTILFSRTNTI